MTRMEAAQICQSIKFILENSDYTEAVEEALDMAIAALEQEETLQNLTKPNKSDLISRQAAIDAVHSYFKGKLNGWPREETEEGYEVYCDMDKIDAFLSDNKYLSKRIENLPSAQLFTEEQIQTMQELEAAQIEKAYELGKADRPTGEWLEKEVFDNQDSEVIDCYQSARCSHCGKYHTTPYSYSFDNYNFCPNCGADMRGGPTLTPEEFAEKMAGIAENGDEESKHVAADSIMCELLKSLGFGEGVGIFEDMDKWYS